MRAARRAVAMTRPAPLVALLLICAPWLRGPYLPTRSYATHKKLGRRKAAFFVGTGAAGSLLLESQ